MLLFRHAAFLDHDPQLFVPGHPDVPERIEAIERALDGAGWLGCERREAPAAAPEDLLRVHSADVIERIRALAESGGGRIDAETAVSAGSFRAALYAAGGACAMVRALLAGEADAGFCLTRPSGHHAEAGRSMGFCLLNNIAIAAELALAELAVERVLVLDLDVHHGNGTAEIFRRRRDVLFASIHQAGLFPGTGSVSDAGSGPGLGFTVNAPVPAGADEEVWHSVLEHVIVPVALAFAPQLILVSAGFDAHRDDPLGGCTLDAAAFAQLACHVRELGSAVKAPVGAVLEGGYHPPALAESLLAFVAGMAGGGQAESIAPDRLVTSRIAAHVAHFWTL